MLIPPLPKKNEATCSKVTKYVMVIIGICIIKIICNTYSTNGAFIFA